MKTILALAVALVAGISAADGPLPLWSRVGEEVTINNPVNGDVYVAGENVTINAPVRGDLVVAGGSVTINDTVSMDVLVGGGTVIINGSVGDDVRCAGGSVRIEGTIHGDAMVTAGEFELGRNADLGGNLVAYGGALSVSGDVHGNMAVTGGEITFMGNVDGSVDLKAESIDMAGAVKGRSSMAAKTLIVAPTAAFGEDITFWNEEGTLSIPSDVAHGKVVFDPSMEIKSNRWELLGFASMLALLWYLGTALVMIWVIEYLFSRTFSNSARIVLNEPVRSFGYGALLIVAVPMLCVLLAFTVLAIPLAVIVAMAYIMLAVFATAITAIVVSNWLNHVYYKSGWSITRTVFVAFGIFVLLKLFTLTPFVGPVLMLVMACMAFGAILISVRSKLAERLNVPRSTSQPSQVLPA